MSVRVHAHPAFEAEAERDREQPRDDGSAAHLARTAAGAAPHSKPRRLPGYAVLPGREGLIVARQTPPAPAAAPTATAAPPAAPSGFPGVTPAPEAAEPALLDLFSDFSLGIMRSGLEGVRLIPVAGAVGGLVADGIEIFQDFRTISGEEAPVMRGLLAARSGLIVLNGLAGHFALVFEEVQDAAVASVFGAELAIITAPMIEVDKQLKLSIDALQLLTDATVAFGAYTHAMGATGESREKWLKLGWGYCANVVGDLLTGAVDLWDASTMGLGNGEVIKRLLAFLGELLKTAYKGFKLMRGMLMGLFNVWDDTILQPPKPDEGLHPAPNTSPSDVLQPPTPSLARAAAGAPPATPGQSRRTAGESALRQIGTMQDCWETGQELLAAGGDALADQIADIKEQALELAGAKDPFTTLRDGGLEMLDELDKRLEAMTGAMQMSGTAGEQADTVRATIDGVMAKIDSIQVPDIDVGHVDVGEGAVAGAIEGVVNTGADLADAGVDAIVARVRAVVEGMKAVARGQLESVRAQADEIVGGMELMREELGPQLADAQKLAAETRAKLERCGSPEEVIDVLVGQLGESLGIHEDFGVAEAQKMWASLGPDLGAAAAWATQLRDSDGKPAPKPPKLSPEPPKPPDPPALGTSAAAGAPAGAAPPPSGASPAGGAAPPPSGAAPPPAAGDQPSGKGGG